MYILWSIYHICHFNIPFSFDCQLVAYQPSLFCLLACLSVHRLCLFRLSAHRPGSFCLSAQRLFAPVNPQRNSAGRPNVSKKHHSFEHLPQVAQSRLVCVLASLERNKMQRKHTLPLLSSKLINNMGNLCANEVNFCRLNSFYFDLSAANQSACYIRSIS